MIFILIKEAEITTRFPLFLLDEGTENTGMDVTDIHNGDQIQQERDDTSVSKSGTCVILNFIRTQVS